MTRTSHHAHRPGLARPIAACVIAVLFCADPSQASDITWRTDYTEGLKEAEEKSRPIVLNVGTTGCFWCKQLDARTFNDPEVAKLLGGRCIPIKIDAEKNAFLIKALKIQSYPTLVFAGADGTILSFKEGFMEADKLQTELKRLLTTAGVPDWMQRSYDAGTRAIKSGDYASALPLLRSVVEDGKDRPIQTRARGMIAEVEKQASEQMSKARRYAETGKRREAAEIVDMLAKVYPGTHAARQSKQLISKASSRSVTEADRGVEARELLLAAQDDYKHRRWLMCLDRCEVLASDYADLPEATKANRLASEITGNTEWARKAAEQQGDRLCVLYLGLADTAMKEGQPRQAMDYLDRVVKMFPSSRHAEAARIRLARYRGGPSEEEK